MVAALAAPLAAAKPPLGLVFQPLPPAPLAWGGRTAAT
jgi:hypothetical protein